MNIVNFDLLIEQEAKVIFKEKEYTIYEPNLKQWAMFSEITKENEIDTDKIMELCRIIIPELFENDAIYEFTHSEFVVLYEVIVKVFTGKINELGKKTRPLHEITKEK